MIGVGKFDGEAKSTSRDGVVTIGKFMDHHLEMVDGVTQEKEV